MKTKKILSDTENILTCGGRCPNCLNDNFYIARHKKEPDLDIVFNGKKTTIVHECSDCGTRTKSYYILVESVWLKKGKALK